ncbi:MAG TPA: dTDP-4-dehydrorhamnose reductase [Chlamydiales bacterium]|nr:dTDP-4-dehydrorhamnose reductase [Chlamydiales bacterium]
MKKIWVLGASGLLGREILQLLQKNKLAFLAPSKKEADITCYESLKQFVEQEEISHIINCAAYTFVDLAEEQYPLAHLINSIGPENLGRIAFECNAKILHFSTDYVFKGEKNIPYTEEDKAGPINAYGKTKLEGEKRLQAVHPSPCIVRTSWLFGKQGVHFVSKMLSLMRQKKELSVVMDQKGRPTFAKDLALAALNLLDYSGIYHFANSSETNWHAFAEEILKLGKVKGLSLICEKILPIQSHQYSTAAKRPAYSVLDTTKIESLLGWKPRSWKEALSEINI